MHRLLRTGFLASLLPLPFVLSGCHSTASSSAQNQAASRTTLAHERQQIDQIPPPTKSRYMSIRSYDNWENPYITVQPDMVTVHVLLADVNPSSYGAGGMLRPIGARREEVNISLSKLAEAMAAIPQSSWPYGRVVAVEEAHQTPGAEKALMRRNLETTVATLNDLGVLAYDLGEGQLR